MDPKIGLWRHPHPKNHHPKGELQRHFHEYLVPKRSERTLVEAAALDGITDADSCVIDHCATLSGTSAQSSSFGWTPAAVATRIGPHDFEQSSNGGRISGGAA